MVFAGAWGAKQSFYTLFSPGRVINAGKSQHNEDQACCEVVFVERRPSPRGRLLSKEGCAELAGVRAEAACTGGCPVAGCETGHMAMCVQCCFPGDSPGSWASCPVP